MPYPAVPDRRMPYDTDGTVVAHGAAASAGIVDYPGGTILQNLQDKVDHGTQESGALSGGTFELTMWLFFPGESREITAYWAQYFANATAVVVIEGSNDTTNGMDGTWELASQTGGQVGSNDLAVGADRWRSDIKPISFTGGKKVVRFRFQNSGGGSSNVLLDNLHVYGQKVAGQTPDDILFLDSDDGGGEFAAVEDFGDRPLGTSVVRQFKVKNSSATHTANSINIQCNDTDFAISTDSVTWVVTINIASLAPGVSSAVLYVKNTTPAPGNPVGPRFARITAIVGSWT